MTEAELLDAVTDLATELGLYWAHIPDSRRRAGTPGAPDLLIVGPRAGVLLAELKSADGEMSPMQRRWRYRIQAAGHRWQLWRPADLESGRIKAELKKIA